MSDIPVDEVDRGDVLLVTRRPHDAFADLIVALDGAPGCFSHSGVALGGGRILSSYPFRDRLSIPLDLGGLRDDPFGHFWGHCQSIHRIAVDDAERARVAGALHYYSTGPGSFSVPKVVVVAATLHALSPSNPIPAAHRARIVRRAIELGEAWASDGDFYCAEFVAHLYGWRFTLRDLVPPRWSSKVLVPYLARVSVDVVAPILAAHHTERQRETMHAFVAEVRRCDPTFFGSGPMSTVDAVREEVAERLGFATDPDDVTGSVDETPVDPTTVLPSCLVTPRMLLARHIGGGEPPRIRIPEEDAA